MGPSRSEEAIFRCYKYSSLENHSRDTKYVLCASNVYIIKNLHSHPKTTCITKSIFLSNIISNIYFKVAKDLKTYEHEDVFEKHLT